MAITGSENIQNTSASDNTNETQISLSEGLKKYTSPLKKAWWLFLIFAIIGGLFGFFYAKSKKIAYRSHLTFAMDEGGGEGSLGGAIGLAAQFGISLGGGSNDVFAGENILSIMKSRRIIENTLLSVDSFDNQPYTFIEYYLYKLNVQKATNNPIHFPPNQPITEFSYEQDSVLLKTYTDFANQFIVAERPNKELNIFEVSVISPGETFSKKFTDRFVQQTNQYYTTIKSQKSKETLDILEERAATMKEKLSASISTKAAVQDANVNAAFATAQVPLLKEQANAQVYGGAYTELFKNIELARFQYLKSIPLMQVIDPANYPMEKVKLGTLKTMFVFSFVFLFCAFLFFTIFYKIRSNFSNSL
jgi:uncharacterized protein involved in exopolysaccharide biosynthesis